MASLQTEPATMENLHEYICQQAIAHAQKPSMPGPPPPASRYIGQRRLKAGPPDEPMVRVMFHCVSPPNSESRHVLLHLRPSVPEEDLAKKLDEIFEIHSNAGVITRTMPEFMPGFNPITVPDKVYSWAEMFEWLASTKGGFMEVAVVPVDAMKICNHCGSHNNISPAVLDIVREWCFGVGFICPRCIQAGVLPDNTTETCTWIASGHGPA